MKKPSPTLVAIQAVKPEVESLISFSVAVSAIGLITAMYFTALALM